METHHFIDRQQEVRAFTELLSERSKQHILLINGIGGMGKSSLLRVFANICKEQRILHTIFTFRSTTSNPLEVILQISRDLGWNEFDKLRHELETLGVPISNSADKELAVDPNVLYAFSGHEVEAKLVQLAKVTSAFLTDVNELLAKTSRIVCMLDDVEFAGPITQDWLFNQFLAGIRATPGTIIVLAGRQIRQPVPSLEAYCKIQNLGGIENSYWQQYAKLITHLISPKMVEALNDEFKGRPLDMTLALSALEKPESD